MHVVFPMALNKHPREMLNCFTVYGLVNFFFFKMNFDSYSCCIIGYNSTLREGNVTHHEYMQVGKGRDVGLNQISLFEAKIANGNGEQTLSRDIYRLGHRFDFFRMLSCYFTTVGFYFSTMVQLFFYSYNMGILNKLVTLANTGPLVLILCIF
jgi:1,3-beta-glucan synthase component